MQATPKSTTTAVAAYRTLRHATTHPVERLRRGRADERGLTTLEWLLIVAAVAGLAALAVVLVQNVVDDTAEQIGGSSARGTAAQVAAERITREKRALLPTLGEAQAVDTAAEVTSLNTDTGAGTAAMDAIIAKQNAVNADGADECARLAITYGDIEGLSAQWENAAVAAKTGTTHIVAANSGTLNDRDNADEANAETGTAFSTARCVVTIPSRS